MEVAPFPKVILKSFSFLISCSKPYGILFQLLRASTCLFFFFSTLTCLGQIKKGKWVTCTYEILSIILCLLFEPFYFNNKLNSSSLTEILTEQFKDYPTNSVHSTIVRQYLSSSQLYGKVITLGLVMAIMSVFMSFYSSEQTTEVCAHLYFGYIWQTDYHIYFNLLNHICILKISFTFLRWYLPMFLMVIRIRCQVRLLCADLDGINEFIDPLDVLIQIKDSNPSGVIVDNQLLGIDARKTKVIREVEIYREFRRYRKIKKTERQIEAYLKNIVEQHLDIIEKVKLTEATFRYTTLFFTQIGAIIVALAIPELIFSEDLLSSEAFILFMVILEGMGLMALFNYFGQSLLNESEFLLQALFNCDWTDKPHSLRRRLLIMQIVASRPLKLTIGGIYTLGMDTFGNVLRAIYSYSSLTHSLKYKV